MRKRGPRGTGQEIHMRSISLMDPLSLSDPLAGVSFSRRWPTPTQVSWFAIASDIYILHVPEIQMAIYDNGFR